jgi:hypothetical protein
MKTFLIILLFSLTSQVKQYQIYEAQELGTKYLERGQMAITSDKVYLKLDTLIYTFNIQNKVFDEGKDVYFVGYDSLYQGEVYTLYRGNIVVYAKTKDDDDQRESGKILVECWTIHKYRKVIYKYR